MAEVIGEFEPPSYNNNSNPKKYEVLFTLGGGYCAIHALVGAFKLIGRGNINLKTIENNLRENLGNLNRVKVRVRQLSYSHNFSSNATERLGEDAQKYLRTRLNSTCPYYGIDFYSWASYYYNIKIVIYYSNKSQIQIIQKHNVRNYNSRNTIYILRSGIHKSGRCGHFETLRPKTARGESSRTRNNNELARALSFISLEENKRRNRGQSSGGNNNELARAMNESLETEFLETKLRKNINKIARKSLQTELERYFKKVINTKKPLNKSDINEIDRLLSGLNKNFKSNNKNKIRLLAVLKNSFETNKINCSDIKRLKNIINFLSKDKKWIENFNNNSLLYLLLNKYLKTLKECKLLSKPFLNRLLHLAINKDVNAETINLIFKLRAENIWKNHKNGKINNSTLVAMLRSLNTEKSNRYVRARKDVNEENKRKNRK